MGGWFGSGKSAPAKAGDEVVLVECCPAGPVYVKATARPRWVCGKCKRTGTDAVTVVLGPGGALPDLEAAGGA